MFKGPHLRRKLAMAFDSLAINKKLLMFAIASSCLFSVLVNGEIVVIPEHAEAATGVTVTLFCRSSAASLVWHHTPVGSISHETVYQDGFILNGYKDRYNVDMTKSGECNLVISNVKTTDAGRFTCMEKSEDAAQKSAELIVFEQYPSDRSCITRFTCPPNCDNLELICHMRSRGNIVPFMEWRDSDSGSVLPSNIMILNGITASSVQMRKRQTDVLSYTCQVKYPTESSLTSQYSWSYTSPAAVTVAEEIKLQNQSNTELFIAVIAVMGIIICVMFVVVALILIYFSKQIRKLKGHIIVYRKNGSNGSQDVESNRTSQEAERRSLLLAADDDVNKAGFVPRTSQNKNNAIHGLGILGNEVFLLTRHTRVIEVFDLHSAKFKRPLIVDGLVNPNDMATCAVRKLIFICDWRKAAEDKMIFCVDKNGTLERRWISNNEKGRISVTKDGNVIVAESWYNTITEYTWSGQLLKKLDTEKQKLHLWHALKLNNGYFVASFGDVHDEIQEICVFDGNGGTKRSITKDSLLEFGISLSVPRSLTVDERGNIFVCDLYGGRIIELTPELQYKGKFEVTENEERLRGPLRVCISESGCSRRLLVADSVKENGNWKDGRILVWNLKAGSNEYIRQLE